MATIKTNQYDYPPGSTAIFTAYGYDVGTTLKFLVQHVNNPGADGLWGTLDDILGDNSGQGHTPWYVTDGGLGDLDGIANGNIITSWYVNPDDSLNEQFLLTASRIQAGSDNLFGTKDDTADETVSATFHDGFSPEDWSTADTTADPLRMITWNVIGIDSNKPLTQGPNKFMVGLRVNADAAGLEGYTVKIVEDQNVDVFGNGFTLADGSAPIADIDDGIDNIALINKTVYENVDIDGTTGTADGKGGYYRDFYFNVEVLRDLASRGQIQPIHFEVFKDDGGTTGTAGNGIWDGDEQGQLLDKFSWLPDNAAANTPLYLIAEYILSQSRNGIENQTHPDADASPIRVQNYAVDATSINVFAGQHLDVRVEGFTATAGYPQLTFSTTFNNNAFQVDKVNQYYNVPVEGSGLYQQSLGDGQATSGFLPDPSAMTGTPNTSIYANPAGWNPALHDLMINSAPPKAGGDPIISDYQLTVLDTYTGSLALDNVILDYSGSSFHYNPDFSGDLTITVLNGAILGNVGVDTDGDMATNAPNFLPGITITLDGIVDTNLNGIYGDGGDVTLSQQTTTTDTNGNYIFTNLLPGQYTVTEGATPGYGDVADTDGNGNGNNIVLVTLDTTPQIGNAADLGFNSNLGLLGYERADFVEGQADLKLNKTATGSVQLGGQVTYHLTVTNTGVANATGVAVTDVLPTGVSFVSASGPGSSTYNPNSADNIWNVGDLAVNESKTLDITVTVDTSDAVTNFAQITASEQLDPDSTPGNNVGTVPIEDDEARVIIEAKEADLSLIKTVDNASPIVGSNITYTLTLLNSGPDTATNIVVKDLLPSNLQFVSASSVSYTSGTGEWAIASLASGASTQLSITASVTNTAPQKAFVNFAEVQSVDQYDPDSQPSDGTPDADKIPDQDDEAAVTVTPQVADLSLTKTVSDRSPDIGDTVTFTLIVTNSGPYAASGVQIFDQLPAGLTFQSDNGTANGVGSYDETGTHLWNVGNMAVGETKSLTITATVASGGSLTNTAYVSSSSLPDPDSVPGANTGTDDWNDGIKDDDEGSVTLTPGASDLSLFKTVSDTTPDLGSNVTFTVTVVNDGKNDAYNVQVKDQLPSGLAFVSATSSIGSYDNNTGIWSFGTGASSKLAPGQSQQLAIVATVNGTSTSNFAQITEADRLATDAIDGTSTLSDTDSTPNNNANNIPTEDDEAKVSLIATNFADLQLAKTVSNPTPDFDGTTTFTLTLTNSGVVTATNITVRDYISLWDTNDAGDIKTINSITVGTTSVNNTTTHFYQAGTTTNYYTGSPVTVGGAFDGDWVIPSLSYGETVTLNMTVTVGSSGGNATARFNNDVTNFAQVIAVDQTDPDSTKNSNTVNGTATDWNTLPTQDDEASATVFNPNATRYDVALTKDVSINGGAKNPGSTLALNDTVVYTVTAINQASDIVGNAYVFDKWPSGLVLTNASLPSAQTGTISNTAEAVGYSTDGGVTWSSLITGNGTTSIPSAASQTTTPITHIRWNTDNSTSGSKFLAGSSMALTLTGTVNTAGVSSQSINNQAWWTQIAGKTDADSSVPDISSFTTANGTTAENDYLNDDLSDGIVDDDEAAITIGSAQTVDLSLSKNISLDGGNNYIGDGNYITDETIVTYRLALTNDAGAGSEATGVKVKDALPTGLVYVSSYGTGAYNNSTGEWAIGETINAGETVYLYIVARVDWDLVGSSNIINYAQISASDKTDSDSTPNDNSGRGQGGDPASQDDNANLTILNAVPGADLSLIKTVDNTTPTVGSNVTFTVRAINDGPDNAYNVRAKDLLPVGLSYVSSSVSGDDSYDNGTGIWTIGTLIAGGISTITITATVTTAAELSNFAEIVEADALPADTAGDNTSTLIDPDSQPSGTTDDPDRVPDQDDEDAVTLTPQIAEADLSLIKTVSNSHPNLGDSISFTLTVVNSGQNDTSAVTVADALPSGFTWDNTPVFSGAAGGDTFIGGVWTLGDVAVGSVHTLTLTGTVDTASPLTNYAQITGSALPDPDSSVNNNAGPIPLEDDEASVLVTPASADLSLTKAVNDATPDVNDTVTFNLTLVNSGPDAATGVQVTDQVPTGLSNVTLVSSTVNGGNQGTLNTGSGLWDIGNVGVGSIAVLTYTATVTTADALSNFAQVTASDQHDPDSTVNNDSGQTLDEDDEAKVTIDAKQADLSLTKTVDNATPNVGDKVTFSITVTNDGPDDAPAVTVNDALPAGLIYFNDDSGTSYNSGSGDWNIGYLASGASATLHVTATVATADAINNYAQVTSAGIHDPDSTPNDDSTDQDDDASAPVDAQQADLALTKSASSPVWDDDGAYYTTTFTLTVSNQAGDTANNLQVTDLLPSGLVYLSDNGAYDINTGTWSVGSLAQGESKALEITAKVTTPAAITNFAEITQSSLPDPDSNTENDRNTDDDPLNGLGTPDGNQPDDDEASASVDVELIDLSLEKTISNPNPNNGDTISYTLTLSNAVGFDDATGIVVTDAIPAGFTITGNTPSIGSYSGGVWTVGNLAAGGSATLTLEGTVTDRFQLYNIAEVTASDQRDVDSTPGNRATNPSEDDTAEVGPAFALISGKVFDDRFGLNPDQFDANDQGIGGVTIKLYSDNNDDGFFDAGDTELQTTTTNASGAYNFYVDAGNYIVVETDPSGFNSIRDLHSVDGNGDPVGDTTSPLNNEIPVPGVVLGEEYLSKNFLDISPFTLSGHVYNDTANDGNLDGNGEGGIEGATLTLYKYNSTNLTYEPTGLTTTSAADGSYSFTGLASGLYRVDETNKAGYLDVTDRDGTSTNNTVNQVYATLQGANNVTNADFLDLQLAAIGDRVWFDRNKDGIQDTDEIGVSDVTVRLKDGTGSVLSSTTTDVNGDYQFTGVAPGTYSLEFDKSSTIFRGVDLSTSRYNWSPKDQGGDDTQDSDVAFITDNVTQTDNFSITLGVDNFHQDAGITPIVIDLDRNGIHTVSRDASQGPFDLLGNGSAIHSGWLSSEDGFLVVDSNYNGQIDSIHEMFGGLAKGDGFAKLAGYDSNNDGTVNKDDDAFADLLVWRDANGNHHTDAGELLSLSDLGLASLAVHYTEQPQLDAQGNLHLERSSAVFADGSITTMTDVYFNVAMIDAEAAGIELSSLGELLGDAGSAVTLTGSAPLPTNDAALWLA